jgi:hypothetical protein
LAAALTSQPALIDHDSGVSLATPALDAAPLPPPARWEGDKGQGHAARGGRCLQDPPGFAAALSLNKPERSRALVPGMTACWRVAAVFEDRLRQALQEQGATVPKPTGQPGPTPPARWGSP